MEIFEPTFSAKYAQIYKDAQAQRLSHLSQHTSWLQSALSRKSMNTASYRPAQTEAGSRMMVGTSISDEAGGIRAPTMWVTCMTHHRMAANWSFFRPDQASGDRQMRADCM